MLLAKHYEKHIFCLEGDWNENLKQRSTILPALELLQLNSGIESIYKTCGTITEFYTRIEQLLSNKTKYGKFQIIYLAFHGFKGGIQISDYEEITLDEFAYEFEGRLEHKIIHFGSCSTLNAHEDDITNFLEKTGALAVSGYQKDIPFISSTVVDLLFFEMCQSYKQIKAIDVNMHKMYGSLCEQLEFKLIYKKSYDSKMAESKAKYKQAYEKWTAKDDALLLRLYFEKKSIKELSELFERNEGAIRSRLKKLV